MYATSSANARNEIKRQDKDDAYSFDQSINISQGARQVDRNKTASVEHEEERAEALFGTSMMRKDYDRPRTS